MDVGRTLREIARRLPEKVAVIFGEKRITFAALHDLANRLANGLIGLGIGRGDRVAIMLPNSSDFAVAYLGVARLGAIGVPLDFRLKGDEIETVLADAEVKVLITTSTVYFSISSVLDGLKDFKKAIVVGKAEGGTLSLEGLLGDESASKEVEVKVGESDEALFLYTSGTTGRPKGVVLTFENLTLFPEVMREALATDEDEVLGFILPMSHISGPIFLNELVDKGSTLVIFDQLRPDKILASVEKHRVTCFHAVPPLFQSILRVPHRDRYDLSSLKWVAMMGMSVPLPLMKVFQEAFPAITIVQGYGLTETSPIITMTPLSHAREKVGSIGRPVSRAEVRLVDGEGCDVPLGEVGEIIVRGPMVMREYHNDSKATRERIRDGWLYTGDLGYFDADGFLYHRGRKDDMIIVGGLNVYPAEIESVILENPCVGEVAVVGARSESRGEVIKAVVVAKPGENLAEREIISFCRERLASFKVPKLVEFKDELPRTSTGKVARKELQGSV
jgi:long-chain acyl-CoA synthetase